MPTDQDIRDFVAMLERLVFQLADQQPQLSPEKVRILIAHKIAQTGLIDRTNRRVARRLD
jgi:hypothetical protein